jgi:hypothetical protein
MTALGQLAAILDNGITLGAGVILILALLVIYGPKYIRAYADLIRAREGDRRQSDED